MPPPTTPPPPARPRPATTAATTTPTSLANSVRRSKTGTEDYSPEAEQTDPAQQKGHVEQNQNPAAVRAAQTEDNDVQRTAWADDDPRYAGAARDNAAFDEKPA
ncbi:MAG: hypothetical protein WKG07_24575 [Hymenobacter sp.]